MTTTCRGCTFLRVPPDKDGKVRVRKDGGYKCTYPIDQILLPASVPERLRNLSTTYMDPDEPHLKPCMFRLPGPYKTK